MNRHSVRSVVIVTAVGLGVFALALLTSGFADWIRVAGINILDDNLGLDYIKALVWGVVLALGILLFPFPSSDKPALLVLWVVKLFVALGFMLLYEQHYGLDSFTYFDDARHGSFSFSNFKFGDGTDNITNLARLQQQLIPDSYHAMKLTSAMAGLIAVYLFYRAATIYLGHKRISVLYILGLFPGILFWSSILGKDPIVLLGIAMYCLGVVGWFCRARPSYLLWMALGILLAGLIRIWLGVIMLGPLAIVLLTRDGPLPIRLLFAFVMAVSILLFQHAFNDSFQIENNQDLYDAAQGYSSAWAEGGSGQNVHVQFTGPLSFVRFAPIGIFTALFRPLPGEILNLFGILASVENVILLALLVLAVHRGRLRDFADPVILWASLFLLFWAAIYGVVSYQNLGTAVRFKLQVLPVLLLLLLHLSRRREDSAPSRFH